MLKKFIDNYWDPYTGGLKTIVELALYLLFYFALSGYVSTNVSNLFFALGVLGWIFNLYGKLRYRMGLEHHLLIPTKNDNYSKITGQVLGCMVFAAGIAGIIWARELVWS